MEDVPMREIQEPSWHDAYDDFVEMFMNQNSLHQAHNAEWGINGSEDIDIYRHCSALDLTETLARYLQEVCGYPIEGGERASSAWQRAESIVAGRNVIDDAKNQEPAQVVLDCLIQGTIAGMTSPGSRLNTQDKMNLYIGVNEYLAGSDARYHEFQSDSGIGTGETTVEARRVLKNKLLTRLIGIEQSVPALPTIEAAKAKETITMLHRVGISRRIGVIEMARVAVVAIYR